jgi:hypothetical protein
MVEDQIAWQRCGRRLDPERADLDGWLVLDARVVVCAACQTEQERERVRHLAQTPPLR